MHNDTFLHPERAPVVQAFGSLSPVRLGLSDQVRHRSVAALNRLLAHTIAIRDLYKKSHWQTSGATFYELMKPDWRAPSGVETAVDQLRRLVDAHEVILDEARPLSREAATAGDEGTNDLIVSQFVRGNELQSWFVLRHLAAQNVES